MITGTVNADREPVVPIRVRDRNGRNHDFAAIVDTGFNGSLTLPLNVITALGLPWKELSEATLADGSCVLYDVYDGTILWDGQAVAITIDESDSEPLIGMEVMDGCRILIEDVAGGLVQIERI